MNLVKPGTRVNRMSTYELVGEFYLQWSGAAEVMKCGLSSNPRAQRLEEACAERIGSDKWNNYENGLFDKITQKSCEIEKKVRPSIEAKFPTLNPNSWLMGHKVAVASAPEVLEFIKEEVKKYA